MKKLLCLLLAVAMLLGMSATAFAADYKIAILTGTTSQGDEEYRAAQQLKAQYPDIVITDTYPDNFSSEVETTIGKLIQFASDPDVKAIIFVQGVQGATAAFQQIDDMGRDDIMVITGVSAEDPGDLCPVVDVNLSVDDINIGQQLVDTAKAWGCDVLVHYSFARHMSYETIVARWNVLQKAAPEAGIELVFRDAPDPTGDAGVPGAQQFILEDVPLVMQEYAGKKVAFFTTNCSMQEPLQTAVLAQENAYYPLPCCPSPYHGFPASMSIAVVDEEYGNFDLFLSKIADVLEPKNALSRFSTWGVPINMAMILGGFDYATRYINGEFTERTDIAEFQKSLETIAGNGVSLTTYTNSDGVNFPNMFLILLPAIDFNEYK